MLITESNPETFVSVKEEQNGRVFVKKSKTNVSLSIKSKRDIDLKPMAPCWAF